MRLRVIIGSLGVGGAERHLSYILPKLHHDYGMSIKVITLSHHNELAEVLESKGVKVSKGHAWFRKAWVPTLIQRFLNITINAIRLVLDFVMDRDAITHFFLPQSYLMGGLIARLVGLKQKLIMSRRSMSFYQKKHPFLAKIEHKLHSKMSFVLGNSEAVMHQLLHEEGCAPEKVRLIYNGIDLKPFEKNDTKNLRHCLGIHDDDLVMIMIANLIPYKGHKDLIKALHLFSQQYDKPFHMLCVGRDDGIGVDLKALANQCGILEKVHFLGSRQDTRDLLFSSDIGILSSHEEGFSNAIIESMAAGLPMVVTDVGGNKEAVLDSITGYVVPSQAPQAMAKALLNLAHDQKKREEMGTASKERAFHEFSLDRCVHEYFKVYEQL